MRFFPIVFLTFALTTSCRITGIEPLSQFTIQERSLPTHITIISWNVHKGSDARIQDDLQALISQQQPELVFLQEAKVDLVDSTRMTGHFANSWQYPWLEETATGVVTLSQVDPIRSEAVQTRWREFFLTTPKVALATEYLLPNGTVLLALNVHCLNFERWGTFKLRSQLEGIKAMMAKHTGPIILAGDFNTWNQKRLNFVTDMARELNLMEVRDFLETPKTGDRHSMILNLLLGIDKDLPLDRVYYRGLSKLSSAVLSYTSSDHRALQVTFSVHDTSATASEASRAVALSMIE
jgi:endonuclease/exonuclease/phosphatase (EEP) superfamily protein YafD